MKRGGIWVVRASNMGGTFFVPCHSLAEAQAIAVVLAEPLEPEPCS